jgi:hypothetical protein
LTTTPSNYNGTSRIENNTSTLAKPNMKGNFLDNTQMNSIGKEGYNDNEDDDSKHEVAN